MIIPRNNLISTVLMKDKLKGIDLLLPLKMAVRPGLIGMVLLSLFYSLTSSCDSKTLFDNTKKVPGAVWNQYETVTFEVPVQDTVSTYRFYLNLRHSVDYRYSNIYFFIETEFPDGRMARDTVECILADRQGKWLGRGISGLKDNQILLRSGLRFPAPGMYRFRLEQAMRVKDLEGIEDIGLRLEKEHQGI